MQVPSQIIWGGTYDKWARGKEKRESNPGQRGQKKKKGFHLDFTQSIKGTMIGIVNVERKKGKPEERCKTV